MSYIVDNAARVETAAPDRRDRFVVFAMVLAFALVLIGLYSAATPGPELTADQLAVSLIGP